MGLDLTLAPNFYGDGFGPSSWFLTHTRIDTERNYSLYAKIGGRRGDDPQICFPRPLPETVKLQWYDDEGLKERRTDPYGDPLTYLTAGELRSAFEATGNLGPWNKAVGEFVKTIPPETIVVLYWH